MLAGAKPALPSSLDSAIEKQPACAAAISSSGLVPLPSAKRLVNEYWVSDSTPLSVEIVPLPSLRLPLHSADALRFMADLPLRSLRWLRPVSGVGERVFQSPVRAGSNPAIRRLNCNWPR